MLNYILCSEENLHTQLALEYDTCTLEIGKLLQTRKLCLPFQTDLQVLFYVKTFLTFTCHRPAFPLLCIRGHMAHLVAESGILVQIAAHKRLRLRNEAVPGTPRNLHTKDKACWDEWPRQVKAARRWNSAGMNGPDKSRQHVDATVAATCPADSTCSHSSSNS